MPGYEFVTVDVFTERRFGGNPLAVFPDARGLSDGDMQALAREFNLSETTFVLPPDDPAHSARVRIFDPTAEMAFAGHPNVGTGFVLAERGLDTDGVLLFEEPAGLVEVRVQRSASGMVTGAAVAAPQPLSVAGELAPDLVARCAALPPAAIRLAAHTPVLASTGNPLVFAEVESQSLSGAMPDLAAFRLAVRERPELGGKLALYLYAHDAGAIRARLFAPLEGIWEDPATGSAATTLAALLLSLGTGAECKLEIRQGVEMGRPSLLRASARRTGNAIRGSVGGSCVAVMRGEALGQDDAR